MNSDQTNGTDIATTAPISPPANPYAAYGAVAEAGGPSFLKFDKVGRWVYGQDKEELPKGTELVPNMAEFKAGYLKWDDGEIVDDRMVAIGNERVPRRDELGDLDEALWPKDEHGKPEDPWNLTSSVQLKSPTTGAEYVYSATSRGGQQALGKLCSAYGSRVGRVDDPIPVIALDASSYRHKKYGEVPVPVLRIVRFTSEAALVAEASGTIAPVADSLDDQIPF